MIKLEDQVCSLGIAKELKALGFEQDSLISWKTHDGIKFVLTVCGIGFTYKEEDNEEYKAYNSDEIYLILPRKIKSGVHEQKHGFLEIRKGLEGCYCSYITRSSITSIERRRPCALISFKDKTMPNALGKMLIRLIKEGLINLEEK